jgi:signal transduction histidine kinase
VEDLLEALLEISRLDAGAIQPEISHFRIDQLLQTLNVEFTPSARAAGLQLRMETDPLWVESDLRLLRRILQNFISNAIRYTASGSVRVTCAVEGDAVRVAVIDTGRGIDSSQQEMIFEEFRRLDTRSRARGWGWPSCAAPPICWATRSGCIPRRARDRPSPSPCRWAALSRPARAMA